MKFSIELPVQFRDIDVMGHVNNATYFEYMETGRVELARKLGQVRDGFRGGFIVASARCEFKKPIRDERRITVSVWVSRIGDGSWDLDYSIRGPSDRQDYTSSLQLQNQIGGSHLRKAQERTDEVYWTASQVQRS